MKRRIAGIALVVFIAAAVAWTWRRTARHGPEMAEGLYVLCNRADCGHFFVIAWDEAHSYPRGPNGEGFRCPRCGQFSGRIAVRCEQCGEWMAAGEAAGRKAGCPKCDPGKGEAGRSPRGR